MNNDPQIDPTSLLPVGTLLQSGKYRVEKYLSSGNFGNTYVVTDMTNGQLRAMKEFFLRGYCYRTNMRQVTMSPAVQPERINVQREKFKKEAYRMRELKGDHVVHVYDLFDENSTTYYVMDYVQGESLASYMEHTGRPLTEEQTLYILDQVLDALDEVHKKQMWHLDLKPDNIMIDRQGKVVIIDFGASKQIGASGKYTGTTGVLCYTPGFAPLEQMSQDMSSIGPWTDIYALGATLYNLLTNVVPTMSAPETLRYPASVSKKTRDLITWMMSIERTKRPQSTAAIRGYLNYNSAQSQQQRPPIKQTAINQAVNLNNDDDDNDERRSTKRKWIIAGSIGGGLIVLLTIILLATCGGNKNDVYDWDNYWEEDVSDFDEAIEMEDAYDYEELARQEAEAREQAYRDSIEYMRKFEEEALAAAEQARIEAEERAAEAEERAAQAERDRQAAQRQAEVKEATVTFSDMSLEHNVKDNDRQMLKCNFKVLFNNMSGHKAKVYMYIYRDKTNIHKKSDGSSVYYASSVIDCTSDSHSYSGWLGIYNDSLYPLSGSNTYYVCLWAKDETTGEWINSSTMLDFSMTGN